MEQPDPTLDTATAERLRSQQPCDRDCAYFALLDSAADWGLCRDPRCPAHKVLIHPGHECPRFTARQ
jgi:hypothetical protein